MAQTEVETDVEPDVGKVRLVGPRRRSVNVLFDNSYFVLGGVAAIWLAWLVLTESFQWGWWQIVFFVLFWLVLAYLVLPRLHRVLTSIYVPDYFIGRARTSDGLLGDPINLALLGTAEQLEAAMLGAKWMKADAITLRSALRMIRSTALRRSYDEAPVSPLLLFGRQQDAAYQQEVRGNPAKRHHVRFWRCPEGWLLPGGHRVDWLAAGTFDRSVGFSLFTLQVTHKIDANTDVERDHIVSTLVKADIGATVRIIRDFSAGYHARNGGGDTIVTDGDLPIVDLAAVQPELVAAKDPATATEANPVAPVIAAAAEVGVAPRPVQTVLGALLMAGRLLAGLGFLIATGVDGSRYLQDHTVAGRRLPADSIDAGELVLGIFLGIVALGLLFYLALAILVFRGSNWARIATMGLSSFLIVISALDYFDGGPQITLRTNLAGLALDILVLLALSSERARAWARRPRETRSARIRRARGRPVTS